MILGTLFVLILILGICVIHYRSALHEFQILQKDYNPENRWTEFLQEQLPLVIRNLPRKWLGTWSRATKGPYEGCEVVVVQEGKRLKTSFANWLLGPEQTYGNPTDVGSAAKLDRTIQNWFSRWFWIPNKSPSAYVLTPNAGNSCLPLWKTKADSTVLVSTDGSPIEVWLSHEAGIPDDIADSLRGLNPWIQSTNEIPGVEKVKFVEIRLRPGNAIVVPTHWWVSVRCEGNESWFWMHTFHSPVSWIASAVRPS